MDTQDVWALSRKKEEGPRDTEDTTGHFHLTVRPSAPVGPVYGTYMEVPWKCYETHVTCFGGVPKLIVDLEFHVQSGRTYS